MKNTIHESFNILMANRFLLVLSSALVVLTLAFALYIGLNVRPSELQLVSHYSAFGPTRLYRDQWFYLLTFGFFGIFTAFLHIVLSVKVLVIKGHSLALMFIWLGIATVLLAWATAYSVLNVWSPS